MRVWRECASGERQRRLSVGLIRLDTALREAAEYFGEIGRGRRRPDGTGNTRGTGCRTASRRVVQPVRAVERAGVSPGRAPAGRCRSLSEGRLRTGLPLAPADPATYYQGGDAGYLTYLTYRHTA